MQFTNQENVKLLNGMHEGLVVLQKTQNVSENNKQARTSYEVGEAEAAGSRVVMFCNRQAKKLFDNFIGQIPTVM